MVPRLSGPRPLTSIRALPWRVIFAMALNTSGLTASVPSMAPRESTAVAASMIASIHWSAVMADGAAAVVTLFADAPAMAVPMYVRTAVSVLTA